MCRKARLSHPPHRSPSVFDNGFSFFRSLLHKPPIEATITSMIAVVQRVSKASVTVEAEGYVRSIEQGLCILLGAEEGDGIAEADWVAGKIARLRIFNDDEDKMNLSVQDVGGSILLISQFTLTGNCDKGNRPSFVTAAHPEIAEPLVEFVRERLVAEHNIETKCGIFGAKMNVEIHNDGPVTLIVERSPNDR